MAFQAPYLSKDDLESRAQEFLKEHHPSRQLPVPIEWIIESRFGLDIVPVPGMQEHFDVVAYITQDKREIRVDEYVYLHRENRYRFSLAHELGHLVLHPGLFEQLHFTDVQSWKHTVTNCIPDREYGFVEWHANEFAGRVLVPSQELSDSFRRCRDMAEKRGLILREGCDAVQDALATYMSKEFVVSSETIPRRMDSDKLW
ncbi:MAG: ImmA/IrrE family metallo-endopeptidase [Planctomycetota bacterium]